MTSLPPAAALLLEKSLAAGAEQAEVLIKVGAARTVRLDTSGAVHWTRTAEGGIALRVFLTDGACGFVSACSPLRDTGTAGSDTSESAAMEARRLDQIVAAAMDAARAPGLPLALPAGRAGDGRGLGIFDPRLHTATPADLEGLLSDAAAEALKADPRVRRLDACSIAASSSEVMLANSAGLEGSYRQTLTHLSLGVVAGASGSRKVFRRSRTSRNLAGFSAALFGDETSRLAVTALEAGAVADGVYPALFAPAAAAEILRAFARTLSPQGAPAGAGQTAGSRLLTIIDDGRMPGGIASAPFDGEGTATRRTTVVSRGGLADTIHDLASGALCGAASTGNGIRASFRDPPRRMPSNFFIAPGSDTPADLMAELRDGVWIQSLRPAPSIRRALGEDGELAALGTGLRVVDGRPAEAFDGVLVSWPIAELMSGIVGIGNDLTFGFPAGSFGSPSLLVKEVGLRAS